jgi:hypothetical protein
MISKVKLDTEVTMQVLLGLTWEHEILYCILPHDAPYEEIEGRLAQIATVGCYAVLTPKQESDFKAFVAVPHQAPTLYCIVRGTFLGAVTELSRIKFLVDSAEALLARRQHAAKVNAS